MEDNVDEVVASRGGATVVEIESIGEGGERAVGFVAALVS